ncbi:MAG: translation elongation factor Ts [Chloroflexota bacterium]|nr:translation elongation factor Ts [Chloroflexota bacterium]
MSSTQLVKQLRERTGAGIMECKRALEESGGDIEKSVAILRQQGLSKADKKSGRDARQGIVDTYIHTGGRIAAMVELNCETDFVARTDDFKQLARDLAMQVAAMRPAYINADEVPADTLAAGTREYGDEKRYLQEVALLSQTFIKDSRRTMDDLVREAIGKLGENIVVRRIARFEVGESASTEPAVTETAVSE